MNEGAQTKSDQIRTLARRGIAVAHIARIMGIRYQHVRKVLIDSNMLQTTKSSKNGSNSEVPVFHDEKPALEVESLLLAGFTFSSSWRLIDDDQLVLDIPLTKQVGVYAFAQSGVVQYVGVATMGLAKRVYFYGKPGVSQKTSIRLNKLIKSELQQSRGVEIYVAIPDDFEWNGLPVHGSAGLELGIIKKYKLPWNKRSAG